MKKQIIFCLTFVSHVFAAQHCFAMEPENKFHSSDFRTLNENQLVQLRNNNSSFDPIVLYEETEGYFKQSHVTFRSHITSYDTGLLKALLNGSVLYYTKHKGAIIYSNETQLTIEKVTPLKDWIEVLTHPNPTLIPIKSCIGRSRNNTSAIKPA